MTQDEAQRRLPPNAAMTMIIQARAIETQVEDRLKTFDLSLRRLGLLGHLRARPGISFSELARRAGIKVQSLQPIVQTLIDLDYVEAVGGVGQGRAASIHLTASGIVAFDRATEALTEIDDELFAEGEWKDLGDSLRVVAQAAFRRVR